MVLLTPFHTTACPRVPREQNVPWRRSSRAVPISFCSLGCVELAGVCQPARGDG